MIYSAISRRIHQYVLLGKDTSGLVLVEFAIMLPIFLIISLGVIEFGMWFYESEITTSSLNNISRAIENNPNITNAQLQQMVNVANDGLVRLSFTNKTNYICVKAYSTATLAKTGGCKQGDLSAINPSPGNSYAVAIDAYVAPNPLTPLGNFVHGLSPTTIGIIQNTTLVVDNLVPPAKCVNDNTSWGALQYNPKATPAYSCLRIPFPSITTCNAAGQVLQFSGGANGIYDCITVTPPPNCHEPWQSLTWNSTTASWSCPNTPYVFAGGIAHPATTEPTAFWADNSKSTPVVDDQANVAWIANAYGTPGLTHLNRSLICQKVTFTVPSGLPAGQIVAQGNLIYPGVLTDGRWKDWSVSFVHLDTGPTPPTTSTYNGSAYACMDNGGNYATNDSSPIIDSEHVSWTVIFIPN